jgi:GH24 family phage-related lysozyme (muramidase)
MMTDIQSSQRAILLIVTEEDGDQNYYLKFESHFSWPGGASGPTVGIGYDCGYSTAEQIKIDWSGFIDDARVVALMPAAGHTGSAGQQYVLAHRNTITISWDESIAQFKGHELPKWEAIVRQHLPNTDKLSGDSFGALVSLTYNRGPSYDLPGNRCLEMRNIKARMAAQQFNLIPNEFLSMRRLWPPGKDLWNRRTHEALLFRDGLVSVPPPVST